MARIKEFHLRFDLKDARERDAYRCLKKAASPKALILNALEASETSKEPLDGQDPALNQSLQRLEEKTNRILSRLETLRLAPAPPGAADNTPGENASPGEPAPPEGDPRVIKRLSRGKGSDEDLRAEAAALDPVARESLMCFRSVRR